MRGYGRSPHRPQDAIIDPCYSLFRFANIFGRFANILDSPNLPLYHFYELKQKIQVPNGGKFRY